MGDLSRCAQQLAQRTKLVPARLGLGEFGVAADHALRGDRVRQYGLEETRVVY